ncbi:D-ribose pyranase [Paenibacillus gansuensis]|uniref:D-ribose pyranase n=1 Tax=Paenibacillus gansuensis TaxID=306542 RepID=A0ABW5PFL9_9BACL
MKKTGIMNRELARLIASLGHTDRIAVVDSGYPIPPSIPSIDLSLRKGYPGIAETIEEIAKELEVEGITYAEESDSHCLALIAEVQAIFPQAEANRIAHASFKELVKESIAVIRTGECIPYSNVILHAGVAF